MKTLSYSSESIFLSLARIILIIRNTHLLTPHTLLTFPSYSKYSPPLPLLTAILCLPIHTNFPTHTYSKLPHLFSLSHLLTYNHAPMRSRIHTHTYAHEYTHTHARAHTHTHTRTHILYNIEKGLNFDSVPFYYLISSTTTQKR